MTSRSLLSELCKRQSILRSVTNVALARLLLPLPRAARVLDAGGPTTTSWESLIVPGERLEIAVNLDPARGPHLVADLDRPWPVGDDCFDLIVSFFVLEHLRRPHVFFEESYRCLRPGGILLLTTVLMHPKHASPCDYFRFTDDGLLALSRDAGFTDARSLPLLAGPLQSFCAMTSPWLLFALVRYVALAICRAVDLVLGRLSPVLTDGWCVGYIFHAVKAPVDEAL